MTLPELSAALASRGLIGESELSVAAGAEANPSPWYVQVMMGTCAWIAGLLLFLFVALGLETLIAFHESWGVVLCIGACACCVAAFLYTTVGGKSSFADQFALAVSIGGQFAIAISIGQIWSPRTALWSMLLVEVALTLVMNNRLHRVLSSLGAVIAWALATHEILFRELPAVAWNPGQAGPYQTSLTSVLLSLIVWAPVAYMAYRLVANEAQWMAKGRDILLRPVTHGLIAALAIAPLATHPGSFWMELRSVVTDESRGTALWPLLAMFLALLALALAFAIRHRSLMGMAIIFALLEVSAFYYVLGTTLLVKSIIMIVLGAGLLVSARLPAAESR